jgi:predicted phosphodiesterase
MRAVKVDLPSEHEQIEILLIADWHWADPQSNHKRILEDIEYVKAHDNCYAVLAGDIMNCAISSSVSDTYGETLSPMEELRLCVELFGGIKDKLICVVPGNHERRHYKTNGIDITELMCRQLGIVDRYSPTSALVIIRFGSSNRDHPGRKTLYTMYVTHGNGGGRKEGGKIQRLVDLATIVEADIYVCGHTHLPATLKDTFAKPNTGSSSIVYCTRLFVNTSAKMDYGGYGDVMGLKPTCMDTPIIQLCGTRKEMRAIL